MEEDSGQFKFFEVLYRSIVFDLTNVFLFVNSSEDIQSLPQAFLNNGI